MTSEATKRARASKQRGASWELAILKGLREEGTQAERLTKAGKDDEGDIVFFDDHGPVIVEAKNEAKIDLPAYIREAELEASNYAKARGLDSRDVAGVVFVKARGKGWLDGYAVQSIRSFLDLGEGK